MPGKLIAIGQCVMFLLIILQVSAQQENYILSGRILDAKSRLPISIARLKNGRQLVITNAIGEFKIKGSGLEEDHLIHKKIEVA